MSIDGLLLTIVAVFGVATLVISQTRDLLLRMPDLVRAWQDFRRAIRHDDER